MRSLARCIGVFAFAIGALFVAGSVANGQGIPLSSYPLATPSPGDVFIANHGGTLGVGGTTSKMLVSQLMQPSLLNCQTSASCTVALGYALSLTNGLTLGTPLVHASGGTGTTHGIYPSDIFPGSSGNATFGGTYPYTFTHGTQATNNTLTFANPPWLYSQVDNSPEDSSGGCVPGSCDISPLVEGYAVADGHAQINPGYFFVQGNSVNNFFTVAFSGVTSASFTIPALCTAAVGAEAGCAHVTIPTTTNLGSLNGSCPASYGVTDGTHTFSGWCTAVTSTTITLVAWEYGSGTSSGQTMNSGAQIGLGQFYVGLFAASEAAAGSASASIYGANIQATLAAANPDTTMAGIELDNINASPLNVASMTYAYGDTEPHTWGYDSVSIGTYPVNSDFDARFVGGARPINGYTCQDASFSCYLVGGGWTGTTGVLQMKHGVFHVWQSPATVSNNYGSVDSAYATSLYLTTTSSNTTVPAIGSSVNVNVSATPTYLYYGDNVTISDGTHTITGTASAVSSTVIAVSVTSYDGTSTVAGSVIASGAFVEADQVWSTKSSPYVTSGVGSASYYSIAVESTPLAFFGSDQTFQLQSNLNGRTPLNLGSVAIGDNHSNGSAEVNIYNMGPAAATAGVVALNIRELVGSIGSYTDTNIWSVDRAGNTKAVGNANAQGGMCPGNGTAQGTACYYSGTGAPTFSAPNGSEYLNYAGTTGSRVYYNTSGASTSGTTWTALSAP